MNYLENYTTHYFAKDQMARQMQQQRQKIGITVPPPPSPISLKVNGLDFPLFNIITLSVHRGQTKSTNWNNKTMYASFGDVYYKPCVCVCVWEREREREHWVKWFDVIPS